MKRALLTILAATTVTACSQVAPTETIRNDISVATEDADGNAVTLTVDVAQIQLRFRGEAGVSEDLGDPSGDFGANILGATLAPDAEASVDPIDCGIYDVRVTDGAGATCEFVASADAPDGGLYLCFVGEVWPLANHIDDGSCADFFPE